MDLIEQENENPRILVEKLFESHSTKDLNQLIGNI